MSAAPSHHTLEANLARLRRHSPDAASQAAAARDDAIDIVEGPRGSRTLSCNGTQLASAYDPAAEGERLAAEISSEPVDLLVVAGLALGHHVEAFHARNPCRVLVYEPDPARLRAALRARETLPLLDEADIEITTDPDAVRTWVLRHYVPGLRLTVYPHPAVLRIDPEPISEVVSGIGRAKDVADLRGRTQHRMMDEWARITVANVPHLLETGSFASLAGAFAGRPAVVAAAGPSLDRQLPLLREMRDRVLIIAIGQSLAALRSAGIEPDLVHVVESQDVRVQLERAGDLSNVRLVLPPQAHPALFELPVGERLLAWQASNPFGCWIARCLGEPGLVGAGGTVAQCAVHLAATLGADPILLIGQDLAFTGGRVYAQSSCYSDVRIDLDGGSVELSNLKEKWGADYATDTLSYRLLFVEGWDGEPVPTDESYASFRESYRWIAAQLEAEGHRVWNCTEGGARIPPLRHLPFAEALAEVATEPLDRGPLDRPAGRSRADATRALLRGLKSMRRVVAEVERRARQGRRHAERARIELAGCAPARASELLRAIGRQQHRIQRSLRTAQILDALIQPELLALGAETHRAAAREPTPDDAAREAGLLFEACLRAVDRARELLDAVEQGTRAHDAEPETSRAGS